MPSVLRINGETVRVFALADGRFEAVVGAHGLVTVNGASLEEVLSHVALLFGNHVAQFAA